MNETTLQRWLARIVNVRPGEVRALLWSRAIGGATHARL